MDDLLNAFIEFFIKIGNVLIPERLKKQINKNEKTAMIAKIAASVLFAVIVVVLLYILYSLFYYLLVRNII